MSSGLRMKIKQIKIQELKPYEFNTKIHNKDQVSVIANSIERFGFRQPIVIDKEGCVIVGHGRLKAAKKLGLKEVPCVIADDLTEDEARAYRIADNKANESEWDFKVLEKELGEISMDMSDFGLEIEPEHEYEEDDEFAYYGDERERTFNAVNFNDYYEDRTEGIYNMPTLQAVDHVPSRMIGFNYAKTSKDYDACVHFYLDDYQFERIWSRPKMYFDILKKFDCCLTPHFSVYYDMPKAMRIWNTYRGRLLGQMMQDYGLKVIPIVYWGNESTYDYAFDGLPENATLSIYTVGKNRPDSWDMFYNGLTELISRKHPKRFLVYGNGIIEDYDYGDIEVFRYENEVTKRWAESKR